MVRSLVLLLLHIKVCNKSDQIQSISKEVNRAGHEYMNMSKVSHEVSHGRSQPRTDFLLDSPPPPPPPIMCNRKRWISKPGLCLLGLFLYVA